MVSAATIAPVSSCWHSFSVIAERITASCHSSGVARPRTHCRHSSIGASSIVSSAAGELVGEAFVGAEEEVQRPLDPEQPLVLDPADRRGRSTAAACRRRADSGYGSIRASVCAARRCPSSWRGAAGRGCAALPRPGGRSGTKAAGRYIRPWRRKRGQKSITSIALPRASVVPGDQDRGVAQIVLPVVSVTPSRSISQKPNAPSPAGGASSSSEEKAGSPSTRGTQPQTKRPVRSTSADTWQLPIGQRSSVAVIRRVQPGAHGRDIGERDTSPRCRAAAPTRMPAPPSCGARDKAGLVGHVVADEDRRMPGKGRLLHQRGDRRCPCRDPRRAARPSSCLSGSSIHLLRHIVRPGSSPCRRSRDFPDSGGQPPMSWFRPDSPAGRRWPTEKHVRCLLTQQVAQRSPAVGRAPEFRRHGCRPRSADVRSVR